MMSNENITISVTMPTAVHNVLVQAALIEDITVEELIIEASIMEAHVIIREHA